MNCKEATLAGESIHHRGNSTARPLKAGGRTWCITLLEWQRRECQLGSGMLRE